MAKQVINIGTSPNSRRGDPLRVAFNKTNQNFTELYDRPVFSGSYNDLTNKPTIPTDVSDLTDDENLLNGVGGSTELPYLELTNSALIVQPPIIGQSVQFTRTAEGSETDNIDEGIELARGSVQGLYNAAVEQEYNNDDHSSPLGTEWNNDGWGDLLNLPSRSYSTLRSALNNQIGENIIDAELVMHDTVNDKYYKFNFTDWGQNNGGSFAYTRNLVTDPNFFKKQDNGEEVDVIVDQENGIAITRGSNQGIFNPLQEESWDEDVSPAGTAWNSDGWYDLSNLEQRTYTTFYEALDGRIGQNVIGKELIMYIQSTDTYYAVKFLGWTQGGNGGGFSYFLNEIDLDQLQQGIKFADGTILKSANQLDLVKSVASGDRRIEEVYGSKTVSVQGTTEEFTESGTLVTRPEGANNWDLFIDLASYPNIGTALELYGQYSNGDESYWQLTFNNVQYKNNVQVYINNNYFVVYNGGFPVMYNEGDSFTLSRVVGGEPVVWWDKNSLPGGGSNFRGAVIDYHAYTGEGTFIGTIHIVDDDGEENITHTEVSSGSTDSENDDLWYVQNEGTISYRRMDGESKTLKVHWAAKVFYGSEYYD